MQYSEYIQHALTIAQMAATEVKQIYQQYIDSGNLESENKADDSPLTKADTVAHEIISTELKKQTPDVPVVSEEQKESIDVSESEMFWLVDPLDGTKEFLKQNGEFTVNIGLIHNEKPVAGVIIVPAQNITYWADENGAYVYKDEETAQISVSNRNADLVAVQSKSHSSDEEEEFFKDYDIAERTGAGSSLKFCRVAEGEADIYYRGGQTMEWDTAAGHAIVNAAGGTVTTVDGEEITYGKPNFSNSPFVCTNGQVE